MGEIKRDHFKTITFNSCLTLGSFTSRYSIKNGDPQKITVSRNAMTSTTADKTDLMILSWQLDDLINLLIETQAEINKYTVSTKEIESNEI
jgi:hypothetical protein